MKTDAASSEISEVQAVLALGSIADGSTSDEPYWENQARSTYADALLFIASKDADIAALDGIDGLVFGRPRLGKSSSPILPLLRQVVENLSAASTGEVKS